MFNITSGQGKNLIFNIKNSCNTLNLDNHIFNFQEQ